MQAPKGVSIRDDTNNKINKTLTTEAQRAQRKTFSLLVCADVY